MERLQVAAVIGSLDEVVPFVDRLARAGGLPASTAGRLRLAVEELFTNSIVHGYGESRGPWSRLVFESAVETDWVWLRIIDDAPPFDASRSCPRVDVAVPLAERVAGGLGLYLARRAVDRMTYEYTGGSNRLTLFVNRLEIP